MQRNVVKENECFMEFPQILKDIFVVAQEKSKLPRKTKNKLQITLQVRIAGDITNRHKLSY